MDRSERYSKEKMYKSASNKKKNNVEEDDEIPVKDQVTKLE